MSLEKLHDLEKEIRFMEKDKEHRSLKAILDEILAKDKKGKKREFSTG